MRRRWKQRLPRSRTRDWIGPLREIGAGFFFFGRSGSRKNQVAGEEFYTQLGRLTYTPLRVERIVGGIPMPTNLAIGDRLILEAQKLGNHRTKKDTVTTALEEYIRRRKQASIVSSFGTVDYDPSYD